MTKSTKQLARELGFIRKRSASNHPEARWKRMKTKCQIFSYLIVIDFESTCWENAKNIPQEIIEFPAILLNTTTGEIEDEFHTYVQPQEHPILSDFCKGLTGISQDQVDNGIPLSICMSKFNRWLRCLTEGKRIQYNQGDDGALLCTFATWSDWDLGVCLFYECRRKQIRRPPALNSWLDLRATYRKFYERKPNGLNGAMKDLGIEFEGREHSGVDDARNTARLAWRMIKDGCVMTITKSLDGKHAKLPPSLAITLPVYRDPNTKSSITTVSGVDATGNGDKVSKPSTSTVSHDPSGKPTKSPGLQRGRKPTKTRQDLNKNSVKSLSTKPICNQRAAPSLQEVHTADANVKLRLEHAGMQQSGLGASTSNSNSAYRPQQGVGARSIQQHSKELDFRPNIIDHGHSDLNDSDCDVLETAMCESEDDSTDDIPERKSPGKLFGEIGSQRICDKSRKTIPKPGEANKFEIYKDKCSASSGRKENLIVLKDRKNMMIARQRREDCDKAMLKPNGELECRVGSKGPTCFKTPVNGAPNSKPGSVGFNTLNVGTSCARPVGNIFKTPGTDGSGSRPGTISGCFKTPVNTAPRFGSGLKTSFKTPNNAPYTNPSSMKKTPPLCKCGRRSKRRVAQTVGPNQGRSFFSCPIGGAATKKGCGYFQWEDLMTQSVPVFASPFAYTAAKFGRDSPNFGSITQKLTYGSTKKSLGVRCVGKRV